MTRLSPPSLRSCGRAEPPGSRHCQPRFWALLIAALGAAPAIAAEKPAEKAVCHPEVVGTATIRAVRDGSTLVLADGREARLAGVEIPTGDRALEAAVAGREVSLAQLGPVTDRYGRLPVLVRLSGEPEPLQNTLLARGHARVAARVGDRGCALAFLAAERAARIAGLGLWAEPSYLVRQAEKPGDVLAERGRFTLVEGTVLSVREAGSIIYVNFGRRWSEDFTVTVPKRQERGFAAAGLEVKKLAGRRVRVRGTIEERGGPWIEVTAPEQIEFAGD
jgi:endonuclease YncB( thermonuclease family)